jgi:hypothetical protein
MVEGKKIIRTIFHIVFLVYGMLGLLGIGPITTSGVLATYMIIYFGAVFGGFRPRD